MEKRTSDRIPKKLSVRFPCCDSFSSGTVTNLSEEGMFINTDKCFPTQAKFEILIPFKKEILNVPVKLVRLAKMGKMYNGMGVKLLNLPEKYLEFVITSHLVDQS